MCADPALSDPGPVALAGAAAATLYLAVTPTETGSPSVRKVSGGITVTATDAEGRVVQEAHVPFTLLAGRSLLRVSEATLDLGTVHSLGSRLTGNVTLSNASPELPLRWRIERPTSFKFSQLDGVLGAAQVRD